MIQKYKRTWCDYLTPCKMKPEIMVAEYECQEECPFFKSVKEYPSPKFNPCDYSRYSYVYEGEVECDCNNHMKKIKLAIVGSRTFNDQSLFDKVISQLEEKYEIVSIVSGGAKGADTMGEKYADKFGFDKLIFYPDWDKYGKRAGFLRNIDIIKNCDVCVAFWDGESHGTKHDIDLCKKYNKTCYIVNFVNNKIICEENDKNN